MLVWHTNAALGGSFRALWAHLTRDGLVATLYHIWQPVWFGTPEAWTIIGVFAGLQLALMRWVPGGDYRGSMTPQGHVPIYRANGVASLVITLALFWLGAFHLKLFSPTIVYDHFGGLLGALNQCALILCVFLYIKGRLAPSSGDAGLSGNPIFDFYWGTELHPRILGWDIKQFTNCRMGMMSWAIIVISFAAKQHELYGLSDSMLVAAALQLLYIAKFFWWEPGYMKTLDISHDRAGFYLCWGCLVWVPGLYTSAAQYLVHHPVSLGVPLAATLTLAGSLSVLITYLADVQRQRVRDTNGQALVWGRPPRLIHAGFTTDLGETKQTILLASGWWGISRHFHYLTEVLGAWFWSVTALFENFMPYVYVAFLVVLLAHRARRDDRRCTRKYGAAWDEYRRRVPYRILPGVY